MKLSNDITKIKMDKSIFLKISREFDKTVIFLHFLASDISIINLFLVNTLLGRCSYGPNGGNCVSDFLFSS